MANRTVKDAQSIHGTNPQYLIEKITRTRIYDSRYWKEECFALSAELLVDKAMGLRYIGGVYGGNIKPTPFLCLTLKMLQIQPEKDIIVEFIKQDDFKYVRALGAFYLRLVYSSLDCFKYLEPLLNDYRKIRFMDRTGQYQLIHMDEFIDDLLREERYCDVIVPRIQKRWVHEASTELDARVSLLDDDLDEIESESDDEDLPPSPPPPPVPRNRQDNSETINRVTQREERHRHSPGREINRPDRERGRDREHGRDKRHKSRSRERGERAAVADPEFRKRRRSRSRERHHRPPGNAYHAHRDNERQQHDYRRGGQEWHAREEFYGRDEREHFVRPEREYHMAREPREHYGRDEREYYGGPRDYHMREEREHHGGREERDYQPISRENRIDHEERTENREERNDHKDRERKSKRDKGERGDKDRDREKRHKREKRTKGSGSSKQSNEIAEQNALRASLGMAPLRP